MPKDKELSPGGLLSSQLIKNIMGLRSKLLVTRRNDLSPGGQCYKPLHKGAIQGRVLA